MVLTCRALDTESVGFSWGLYWWHAFRDAVSKGGSQAGGPVARMLPEGRLRIAIVSVRAAIASKWMSAPYPLLLHVCLRGSELRRWREACRTCG